MAEAWVNFLAPGRVGALSAGTNPTGYVHPSAIDVMNEVGIDMGEFKSKAVSQFIDQEFDFVITVCDDAAEHCPTFPGPGKRIHWPFEDPASFVGSEDQVKEVFRKTRDDIRMKVEEFLRALSN
jgi:arsenate reductase